MNGDVADRGPHAVEIFLLVFALKLLEPKAIFFNRGNHESEEMNLREPGWGGGFAKVGRRSRGTRARVTIGRCRHSSLSTSELSLVPPLIYSPNRW